MDLRDKIIVVTGAGSGVGRDLTRELVRRGASVAAVDLNAETLAETASLAGPSVATFVINVADRAAVEALPARVIERFQNVDGVINNAGIIQPFVPIHALDFSVIDRVFAVNWQGTLNMTKAFLPLLLKRPIAHIVNVTSMGAFIPFPGQTAYSASKAAAKLFTEGLAVELAGTSVHVTLVLPGAMGTNIAKNSGVEIRVNAGDTSAIYPSTKAAEDIANAIENNVERLLIGKDAKMLDVLYRLNPRRAAAFIAKQMKKRGI